MTLTLDLTPELEARLQSEAARLGLPVNEYALHLLDESAPTKALPKNGAELVAYWEREGVLGIWADRTDIPDSPEYARLLRHKAEHRDRD